VSVCLSIYLLVCPFVRLFLLTYSLTNWLKISSQLFHFLVTWRWLMKLHALTIVDHIVFCKFYLIYLLIHNLNLQAAELSKFYLLIFKRMRYFIILCFISYYFVFLIISHYCILFVLFYIQSYFVLFRFSSYYCYNFILFSLFYIMSLFGIICYYFALFHISSY
jgi:hypothetical protein